MATTHAPELNTRKVRGAIDTHMQREGLSQRQFAIRCGIDPSNVSKFRAGKVGMSRKVVAAVAAELGVDPVTFYGDDE